ncbi:acetyl-CoA carboxylase carboxyl transferase subunit beta [Nocardioides exalbidus]|uniref:Acetyl-CoA carboxylase carboxyl transferase subunit beta n=1 Tax=Nocardioides exalbidus TaxID=402596 RepID=A0A1H4JUB5_9ACTN|nr:carboxyl transferase domain-containing protein [Nocardioides exalbidus]SEB49823.1 acetyl-CoA carboxylase carboxyl transferase subunit beta [Nocardioides exalbidus]
MTKRWTAHELLDLVFDEGSFVSWDEPIDLSYADSSPDPGYRAALEAAAEKAGTDESVLTGQGEVRGRPVAVVVNEFRFLAGSIGRVAADRITSAVRRATAEGLPLMASTASGGTRMQEGTPAFVRMVEISRALMDHRAAGLPYLVHLRHPTTGGVYASWGSLGHVTVAEPGALVGFLGPKVYEGLHGRPFRPGVQVAENLAATGVIDGVVPAEQLPEMLDQALAVLVDGPGPGRLTAREPLPIGDHPAWDSVERTRRTDRVGVRDLLAHGATGTLQLRGTDEGERDSTVLVALTRLDDQPCVVIGQDRSRQTPGHAMGPGALREARRGMRLAQELGLPLVSIIDTPGAELSPEAEERAIAGEIARCIATLTTMSVPTVSVILGQGCGGGALAFLPARTVVATEHAWLSPLPPEGASLIVHGDVTHAPEMASRQHIRATDLLADGVVQHVVPEVDGESPADLAVAVAAEIGARLRSLSA